MRSPHIAQAPEKKLRLQQFVTVKHKPHQISDNVGPPKGQSNKKAMCVEAVFNEGVYPFRTAEPLRFPPLHAIILFMPEMYAKKHSVLAELV